MLVYYHRIETQGETFKRNLLKRPLWSSGKVSALGPEGFQARNPIPQKIRLVLGILHVKSYVSGQMSSRWCGSSERECQIRCRPRHLTAAQNYDVCSKIALMLLLNRMLI
ncbi:hypothetical protein AVEN_78085-1 [Araneus ventricosus]|uniref:Uncharacterized protein n=1 Tax=Araneus ventricosus TaxID=182803 RepID=A0A4Y2F6H6_ARAVE|nr:hypothetical protein AVEN_78085-1 [Araneus ventricosus]